MRVLFLVNSFPPGYTGGAEVSSYNTCQGLIRRGIDCSILVTNNRRLSPVDERQTLDGIPVRQVGFSTPRRSALSDVIDWRVYRAVLAELRQLKPDLVHVHNVSGSTMAPYLACRAAGVPVVNTLHDLWLLCPNNILYRPDGSFCSPARADRNCQACFRRYDFWGNIPRRRAVFAALTANVCLFTSPSQALIDRHVEAGYAPERFRLVRLGFEPQLPDVPRDFRLQSLIRSAPRYRTLIYAGGGVEVKGAGVLIQAVPTLLRYVEGLRVIVAGGGEKHLLAQFDRYAPDVRVLGRVPFKTMRSLFASADLSTVPSVWHENSPVTIYENFHVGTPVVASDLGGMPELIREGETGYLFPAGDPVALAEKVIAHFARPSRERRQMRRNCVEVVRTQLTLESHIESIIRVYREVLDG